MKGGKIYFVASILLSLVISQDSLFAQTASWRITTSAVPWVDSGSRASTAWAATTNYIELFPDTLYQTIQGFGGCFSDKGWDAMTKVSALQQDSVIRALFDTSGCNFNDCRLPIGASDFADGYYSLDDSSGDYAMTHFNLTHDSTRIIPFIKAGMVYQPNLVVWGSPWTPPWMNENDGDLLRGRNPEAGHPTLECLFPVSRKGGESIGKRQRESCFAVTHHRSRRDRAMTSSLLDELPGVGPRAQARAVDPLRLAEAACQPRARSCRRCRGCRRRSAGNCTGTSTAPAEAIDRGTMTVMAMIRSPQAPGVAADGTPAANSERTVSPRRRRG